MEATHPLAVELKRSGIPYVVTVPESWTAEVDSQLRADPFFRVIPVAREEEGIGVCAGLYVAGRDAAFLIQNGGMLGSVNALAGVGRQFNVPVLMLVAYRGSFGDTVQNAVNQIAKGIVTEPVLRALEISYAIASIPEDLRIIRDVHQYTKAWSRPAAVLLRKEALLAS